MRDNKEYKKLTSGLENKGGRSHGKITIKSRGSYNQRRLRFIDYKRIIFAGENAIVYMEHRNKKKYAHVGIMHYREGIFTYILLPSKIQTNSFIKNLSEDPRHIGDSAMLSKIADGSLIHNISLSPRTNGQFIRGAGCSSILVRKEDEHVLVKLKSGELRFFHKENTGSLGVLSNEDFFVTKLKKAGANRYLGKRPRTRPSAMNPVDHPMGGRTRGGFQPTNEKGVSLTHKSTKKWYNPNILLTKRRSKFKQ